MRLLEVNDLKVTLNVGERSATIVDKLSLTLDRGRCLGLVGESGSGKSTAAMAVIGLLGHGNLSARGSVRFQGAELIDAPARTLRALQGRDIAMIFQDPMSALNPVQRIGDQIVECVRAHETLSTKEAQALALDALKRVGMPDPPAMMRRYPHQLSGGQRQRVMIAMAIVFKPTLLIADEPTTALDLTIQAQILALFKQLSRELDMAVLLITHDLGVISDMADDIVVLYAGRSVERGRTADVLDHPGHPYTRGLLAAHPSIDETTERLTPIAGMPPPLWDRPQGCAFAPRCHHVQPTCTQRVPDPVALGTPGHLAACILAGNAKTVAATR